MSIMKLNVKRFYQFTMLVFFSLVLVTVRLYMHLVQSLPPTVPAANTSSITQIVQPPKFPETPTIAQAVSALPEALPSRMERVENLTIWQLRDCFGHLLITSYAQIHLDHTFSNETLSKSMANLTDNCDMQHLSDLLTDTERALQELTPSVGFTFHDLLFLRRSIMIVMEATTTTAHPDDYDIYKSILKLTSNMEHAFATVVRKDYPIFNIHLPRSAGTTFCYQFRVAQYHQNLTGVQNKKEQMIKIAPNPQHNCNIGDGFPFYQYLVRSHAPKSCQQQYDMAGSYNMFARESPLYPNNMDDANHAGLCGKFVYILPVRSPIERILSWLKIDSTFYPFDVPYPTGIRTISNVNKDDSLQMKDFINGFFDSVFDYDTNPPYSEGVWVTHHNNSRTHIKTLNSWYRQYSNNALTRWIGYEFNDRELTNNELVKSMLAHKDVINKHDIHFYNAIRLMLQVDYVLNFASYGEDDSVRNIMKYALDKPMNTFKNIVSERTRILDPNNEYSVWNMMAKHLNQHYSTNKFDWNRDAMGALAPKQNELFSLMSPKDWKALYQENAFDFRLYSFAKTIGKIDVQYYKAYDM